MSRNTPEAGRPDRDRAAPALIGAQVRVVARRGETIEGICLDAWPLRHGGTALKIKPRDGSPPREVTTLRPVVVLTRGDK